MKIREITQRLFKKNITEHDMVRGICRNDQGSLRVFYNTYLEPVYRFIYYRISGDKDQVDDLVSETFMAAIQGMNRFDFRSSLFTWLCTIAGNKIRDHYRRTVTQKKMEVAFADLEGELRNVLEVLESGEELPDAHVERVEIQEVVRGVLSSLPPRYQQVLEMRYVRDLKVREIGEQLGASLKSVESALLRAQKAFYQSFILVTRNMGTQELF